MFITWMVCYLYLFKINSYDVSKHIFELLVNIELKIFVNLYKYFSYGSVMVELNFTTDSFSLKEILCENNSMMRGNFLDSPISLYKLFGLFTIIFLNL